MELNGRKWNQIKVLPLLRTPESRPTPIPLSGCRGRSRTALTSCHPQRTPNPPTIPPQRSVQQTTSTRQMPVADMPISVYDDSNAAAKTRFRPSGACNPLTHANKVPTSVARPTATRSDPGRGQGTPPEPVPVPATQSRGGATDPGFCLSPSPIYERNETK